jgi:hypothetical protein
MATTPGFSEHERAALTKLFREIGKDAEAQRDGSTIIPFTKGVRQVLIYNLLAATDAAIESAKAYAKELDDVQAQRLTWLEDRVRKLEQKAN